MNTLQKYFKLYWANGRRSLTINALVIFLALAIVASLTCLLEVNRSSQDALNMQDNYTSWGLTLFLILGLVTGCRTFGVMSRPEGRLTTLTLPASARDKFWTYMLIYVVGYVMVFMVSYVLVDVLRAAVMSMTSYTELSHCTGLKALFTFQPAHQAFGEILTPYIVAIYALAFMLMSFGALGSIVFPRHTVLVTIAVLFAFQIVCTVLLTVSMVMFFSDNTYYIPRFGMSTVNSLYLTAAVMTAVAVFNYWLSYKRFTESEVQNRW